MAVHQEFEELAAGHALNALEPGDEQLFLEHLAGCAECRQLLADFSEVAAGLAISSADERDEMPPSEVWAGIVAGVAQDQDDVVVPLRSRHRFVPSREMLMGAAAALVLVTVGVAGWKVATSGSSSPSVKSAVSDCRHSSGCHVVQLTGASNKPVSTYLLIRGQDVSVATSSLPSLDAAHETYVLWQMPQAGRPTGVVAFEVPSGRHATVARGTLPLPYGETTAFAISREMGTTIPPSPSTPIAIGAAST
jgi:anti-sigma factor RsiW